MRANLAACVAILPRPSGWSAVHAIAFLLHAAHVVDRQVGDPLPEKGRLMLMQVRKVFDLDEDESLDTIVAQAAQLLQRCGRSRFVLVRALEDQLMHLVQTPLDFRELVVQLVNHFAADGTLSPLRRNIITTTMAVLGDEPAGHATAARLPGMAAEAARTRPKKIAGTLFAGCGVTPPSVSSPCPSILIATTRTYGPMVLRRCRKLLGDDQAARDAMHDVFVQVLSRADELADQAPVVAAVPDRDQRLPEPHAHHASGVPRMAIRSCSSRSPSRPIRRRAARRARPSMRCFATSPTTRR